MDKENTRNLLVLVQTVLAVASIAIGIGYLFEKSYLILLEIILAMFTFLFAYNNYMYYKIKMLTKILIIFGFILLIGVVI